MSRYDDDERRNRDRWYEDLARMREEGYDSNAETEYDEAIEESVEHEVYTIPANLPPAEAVLAYLEMIPEGDSHDVRYFLQNLDESEGSADCECRIYQEYAPDEDNYVEHLEKVLTVLCPSISFYVKWGSYFEIKVRIRWQEGSLQIPLAIQNVQHQRIIGRTKLLKEELIAKVFAPERVAKWLECGDAIFEMMMGI